MASLKALKIRIGSVKSTQKITKAMKMVAAAKLRRAQSNAEQGRPYSQRLSDVVASLASRITVGPQSPRLIAGTGADQRHLIVVASSDRGLAGAEGLAAPAGAEIADAVDELLGVFGGDFQVDRVDVGEPLEQHRLPFHHGLGRKRAAVA